MPIDSRPLRSFGASGGLTTRCRVERQRSFVQRIIRSHMTRWWREPSVPLAVKTLLGHTFPETLGLCGSNPGRHGGRCQRYEFDRACQGEFRKSVALLTGDGGFESRSLQRGV
jgi:hypothetical protein